MCWKLQAICQTPLRCTIFVQTQAYLEQSKLRYAQRVAVRLTKALRNRQQISISTTTVLRLIYALANHVQPQTTQRFGFQWQSGVYFGRLQWIERPGIVLNLHP